MEDFALYGPAVCNFKPMNISSLKICVLLCLIGAAILEAQEKPNPETKSWTESYVIHPSLPAFIFELEHEQNAGSATIKISGGPKKFAGQTIRVGVDANHAGFNLQDVNFDGYQDLSFLDNLGATGNASYTYWVFDPKKCVFAYAVDFDHITSADEKNKLLISYAKGGSVYRSLHYYRVINGKPVLVKSIQTLFSQDAREIIPHDLPNNTAVKITRLYQDGKLKRTFFMQLIEDLVQPF